MTLQTRLLYCILLIPLISLAQQGSWVKMGRSFYADNDDDLSNPTLNYLGDVIAIGWPEKNRVRSYIYNGVEWDFYGQMLEPAFGTHPFAPDSFGSSVSLSSSGQTLAVGHADFWDPGKVHFYEMNNNTWLPTGSAIESGERRFGSNIEMDGDGKTLLIETIWEPLKAARQESGNWMMFQIPGLTNTDPRDITISEDGNSIASANYQGVQAYEKIDGVWEQKGNLIEIEVQRVAISANGHRIITGYPYGTQFGPNTGEARVFDFQDGEWLETAVFYGRWVNHFFGHDVDISDDGNRVIVGEPGAFQYEGSARVIEFDGNRWSRIGQYLRDDLNRRSRLGSIVAISGNGSRISLLSDPLNPWDPPEMIQFFEFDPSILSVNSATQNNLSLFPNPAKSRLHIRMADLVNAENLKLYDSTGRLIWLIEINDVTDYQTIDVSPYASGTYFIKLDAEEGNWTKQFIKH